jgi:hypothetical protein
MVAMPEDDPFAWQRKREAGQRRMTMTDAQRTEAQRWRKDVLEELRGIRKAIEEANGREIEYFADGVTIKRVRVGGLCGWPGPIISNVPPG